MLIMEKTKPLNIELPLSVRRRLIERAGRNKRSMRKEALAIIEAELWQDDAVREDPDQVGADNGDTMQ